MEQAKRYITIFLLLFCISASFTYIFKDRVKGESVPAISLNTKIVAFGDSLVSGTGATLGNDFVSVLSRRIGMPITNAGISGDTTASALSRVDRDVISLRPNIVIVFLGGNDILQRLPQAQMFANLKTIIQKIQDSGARVIVVGIHNEVFGIDYEAGYRNVAAETGAAYVPNALLGIVGNNEYSVDRVHPNNAGYLLVADRVFPVLQNTINALPNQTLTVTCRASHTSAPKGQAVTWNAYATGGVGNYRYEWNGTDSLSGSGSSVTKTYSSEGNKTGTVTVTSGGSQSVQNCAEQLVIHNVQSNPLTGQCSVSAFSNTTTGNEYRVRFESLFYNTATTTKVTWTGTDNISSNNHSVEKVYNSPGLKTAQVVGVADTEMLPLSCSVSVPPPRSASANSPIGGQCSSIIQNKNVTWGATGYGAAGNYTYQWNGTDGLIGTSSTVRYGYTNGGTKTANVTISSAGERIDLSCQVNISNEVASTTGCFIATAAFGTELEPEVETLRHFRDEELEASVVGRAFVDMYYELSPPVADYIRDKEVLKSAVRNLLRPAIYTLEKVGY